jgi:hypothetical protein
VRVDGTWTVGVRPARAGPATVAIAGNTVGIWLYDLDANRGTRILVHDPAFPTTGFAFGTTYPIFNPDGTHLAYGMRGGNRCRIVDRDLRTSVERVVGNAVSTNSNESGCESPLDWSLDGRFLLVRRDSTLRIIPTDGTRTRIGCGASQEGHPMGARSRKCPTRAAVPRCTQACRRPSRVSRTEVAGSAWTHGGRHATPRPGAGGGHRGVGCAARNATDPVFDTNPVDDNGTGLAVVGDGGDISCGSL